MAPGETVHSQHQHTSGPRAIGSPNDMPVASRTGGDRVGGLVVMFLALLPLVVFGIGWGNERRLRHEAATTALRERAEVGLDILERERSLEFQIGRFGLQLREHLSRHLLAPVRSREPSRVWTRALQAVPRCPLPDTDVWILTADSTLSRPGVVRGPTTARISRRLVAGAFAALVRTATGQAHQHNDRSGGRLVEFLFGPGIPMQALAVAQRAAPTPVVYREHFGRLLWDVIRLPDRSFVGIFVVARMTTAARRAAMRLAVHRAAAACGGACGLIALRGHPAGDVTVGSTLRSQRFRQWAARWRPAKAVFTLEHHSAQRTYRLGPSEIRLRAPTHDDHLAVVSHPTPLEPVQPPVLFLGQLVAWALLALYGFRGLVLDSWPRISLRAQFMVQLTLVTLTPVIGLMIWGSQYIAGRETDLREAWKAKYLQTLAGYDVALDQLATRYIDRMQEACKDPRLLAGIARLTASDPAPIDALLSCFYRAPMRLPVALTALFGPDGTTVARVGEQIPPGAMDGYLQFGRVSRVETLRANMVARREVPPSAVDFSDTERAIKGAYESSFGTPIQVVLEEDRDATTRMQFGRDELWQLHRFISVGRNHAALLVTWRLSDLRPLAIRAVTARWRRDQPQAHWTIGRARFGTFRPLAIVPAADQRAASVMAPDLATALREAARTGQTVIRPATAGDGLIIARQSTRQPETVLGVCTGPAPWRHHTRTANLHIVYLLIAGLLLSVVAGWVTTARIMHPLLDVTNRFSAARQGSFHAEPMAPRADELGALNSALATMLAGLEARRRLAALVATSAPGDLDLLADAQQPGPAQCRPIVAVVSDIRSFTTLCEAHPPEAITALLNDHFSAMARVVADHGGAVEKFIGDAVRAVFVIDPTAPHRTAAAAVAAALAMLAEVDTINRQRAAAHLFAYRTGVGLAMGPALLAAFGDPVHRLEVVAMGQPMKRAAELEALSKQHPTCPLVMDRPVADALSIDGDIHRQLVRTIDHDAFAFATRPPASRPPIADTPTTTPGPASPAGAATSSIRPGQVIHDIADPMNRSHRFGQRGEATVQRPLGWLAGCVALLTAALIVLSALGTLTTTDRSERVRAAREKNARLLDQLAQQTQGTTALETRMQSFVDRVAERLAIDTAAPGPITLQRAIFAGLHDLFVAGLRPTLIVGRTRNGTGTVTWPTANPQVVASLTTVLDTLLACYDLRHRPDRVPPGNAWETLGTHIAWAQLAREYRGQLCVITYASASAWMYWQPLVSAQRVADLRRGPPCGVRPSGSNRNGIPNTPAVLHSGPPPDAFLDGGVLIILPRHQQREQNLRPLLAMLEDESTALAFRPDNAPNNTDRWTGPRFSRLLGAADRSPHADRIWETRRVYTPQRGLLLATTAVPSPDRLPEQVRATVTGLVRLALALSLLLWSVAFLDRGVARHVRTQMVTAFFFATLLPLAGLLHVGILLGAQWQDHTVTDIRQQMRREIAQIDRRRFVHQPLIWRELAHLVRAASFSALLDRIGNAKRDAETMPSDPDQIKPAMQQLFNQARRSRLRPTVASLVLTGPKGLTVEVSRLAQVATSTSHLATSLLYFGERTMARVRSGADADTPESAKPDVQGELVAQTLAQAFLAIFGPEATLSLLYAPTEPLVINCGPYSPVIRQVLLPSDTTPRFSVFWLYHMAHAQVMTMYRILSPFERAPDRTPLGNEVRYFALEKRQLGMPVIPEDGEALPFLRPLGRQIAAVGRPVSTRIQHDDASWLVEGVPENTFSQFIYFGVVAEAPLQNAVRRRQLALFAALLFALLLVLALARGAAGAILAPLVPLRRGLAAVALGNFAMRLPVDRSDELGTLVTGFNEMARAQQEREALGRMVSQAARRASASAEAEERARRGERLDATILFVGVPGLDRAATGSATDDLQLLANRQLGHICATIIANGGDIDKILGDKVLAVFAHSGADNAAHQAATGAATAAWTLHTDRRAGLLPFAIAAGIGSGLVIAGLIGAASRRDYTVIGDTVNLAARAEAAAEAGSSPHLIVTDRVAAALDQHWVLVPSQVTAVKGKREPVRLLQIVDRHGDDIHQSNTSSI